MIEELNLQTPYRVFKHSINSDTFYQFTTGNDTVYKVVFLPCAHYFPDCDICADKLYMLNFDIAKEVVDKREYDNDIELTIAGITNSFFETVENVMLFVCDSTDNRQRARKITFNKWYNNNHQKMNLLKMDYETPYYTSVISRVDNPDFPAMIKMIESEIEAYADIDKDQ